MSNESTLTAETTDQSESQDSSDSSSDVSDGIGFCGFGPVQSVMPHLTNWKHLIFALEVNDANPGVGSELLDIVFKVRSLDKKAPVKGFRGFTEKNLMSLPRVDWKKVSRILQNDDESGSEQLLELLPGRTWSKISPSRFVLPRLEDIQSTSEEDSEDSESEQSTAGPSISSTATKSDKNDSEVSNVGVETVSEGDPGTSDGSPNVSAGTEEPVKKRARRKH